MKNKVSNPKREPVEVVAIIPARAGKQSTPWKNLQKLGGKTLLAWAVEVALAAEKIDAVIVSTEDAEIADEARKLGALVAPRPSEYSQPTSGDAGFYHHAVTWMEAEFDWIPELLVNLRPTSPLRFPADIDEAITHLQQTGADGLKSVIPTPLHPYKMWQRQKDGKLIPVFDSKYRRQRGPDQPRQKIQELFPVYFQDGQIDITRRKFVLRPECLQYDNVWGDNIHGYVLDPRTSTDLDTPDDFRHAEKIYQQIQVERGEEAR
ncbi:MAG: acylneuraminate cytidylyltransferase family protein [Candidatus Andersenbacteria bacterium]